MFLTSIPWQKFLLIAVLRTLDLGLTNTSMKYVNYPVKTLMKSSRVIFTMFFGTIIMKKRHRSSDYVVVTLMVTGLALFIHAETSVKSGGGSGDSFSFVGIGMLTVALLADGVVVNSNELLMKQHGMGQDEFIFAMYILASGLMFVAASVSGELATGVR